MEKKPKSKNQEGETDVEIIHLKMSSIRNPEYIGPHPHTLSFLVILSSGASSVIVAPLSSGNYDLPKTSFSCCVTLELGGLSNILRRVVWSVARFY